MIDLYNKINLTLSPAERFTDLAKYLFFNCYLKARAKEFYFTELEFYCDDNAQHQDKFIYKKDKQRENGKLCFHQSGMDITFGNGDKIYGGVLVRGIKYQFQGKWKYIYGPINILNKGILPALKISNKTYRDTDKELVKELEGKIEFKNNLNQRPSNISLYRGPRYNLKHWHDKNTTHRSDFMFAPYRYIIDLTQYRTSRGKEGFVFEGTIKDIEKLEYAATLLGDLVNKEKFEEMAKRRMESSAEEAEKWENLVKYYKQLN